MSTLQGGFVLLAPVSENCGKPIGGLFEENWVEPL